MREQWNWTVEQNNIEQLKGKILESITPEEFHFVKRFHQISYKKSFDLTKKETVRKFDELIRKNEVTQSATNITDNKKCIISMYSWKLTHVEADILDNGLNFTITSKTLRN